MKFIEVNDVGEVIALYPMTGVKGLYPGIRKWAEKAKAGNKKVLHTLTPYSTIIIAITEYRLNQAKQAKHFFKSLNPKNKKG